MMSWKFSVSRLHTATLGVEATERRGDGKNEDTQASKSHRHPDKSQCQVSMQLPFLSIRGDEGKVRKAKEERSQRHSGLH